MPCRAQDPAGGASVVPGTESSTATMAAGDWEAVGTLTRGLWQDDSAVHDVVGHEIGVS